MTSTQSQRGEKGIGKASRCSAGALLLFSGWLGLAQADGGQPPASGELRTFSQLWALSREQALKGRPVRFKGIVVCCDPAWGQLYVQDESETKYFSPQSFPSPLQSGLTGGDHRHYDLRR